MVVEDAVLLGTRQRRPVAAVGQRADARRQLLLELGDRARAVGLDVVPGAVDLQEDPLRPPVEVDVRGGHRTVLVVREAELADLLAVARDVRLGGGARVRARLHRVLLGRQAERVEAHRVQHRAPGHAQVAAEDVGPDEPQRVPDVQARAGGVREHVHQVELLARRRGGRVRHGERVRGLPAVLPAPLDRSGERGGVAVGRHTGGTLGVGSHVRRHLGLGGHGGSSWSRPAVLALRMRPVGTCHDIRGRPGATPRRGGHRGSREDHIEPTLGV